MLDKYWDSDDKLWIVTYQRIHCGNVGGEIITLYKGSSEKMAQKIFDDEIEKWG